jgi:hypothetical protein
MKLLYRCAHCGATRQAIFDNVTGYTPVQVLYGIATAVPAAVGHDCSETTTGKAELIAVIVE